MSTTNSTDYITGQQKLHAKFSLNFDIESDKWDMAKQESTQIAWIYKGFNHDKVKKWGKRIDECATSIIYKYTRQDDNRYKRELHKARLCRVRTCPICAWRRSLRLQSDLVKAIKVLQDKQPNLRASMLTLTVKNCAINDLKSTLQEMLRGWSNLTKRKSFKGVVGWWRSVEVTRGKKGDCHPHIHALLITDDTFNPQDFNQYLWASEWQRTLKLDYRPICHIMPATNDIVCEVAKYTVKPADGGHAPDWLPYVALQLDNVRAVASSKMLSSLISDSEDIKTYASVEDCPIIPNQHFKRHKVVYYYYSWQANKRKYIRDLVSVDNAG